MFTSNKMRALKVLGPMYHNVLKKKSEEELKRFFEYTYMIWDDYSLPPKQKLDMDSGEQAWLTNQQEKVHGASALINKLCSHCFFLSPSTFKSLFDGLCGILCQIHLPTPRNMQRLRQHCTSSTTLTIAHSKPPEIHPYHFSWTLSSPPINAPLSKLSIAYEATQ